MAAVDMHEVVSHALKHGLPGIRRKVKRPRIHSIISEIGANDAGNAAIWVWVILDDPRDSEMTEEHRNRIRKAIVETLQGGQGGFGMPIYFFFQTRAERVSAGFPT